MVKPELSINKNQVTDNWRTLGMSDFLLQFINSGEFDIKYHDDFISTTRGERATILYYNGKSIYLDFWEYPAPTYSKEVFNKKFDLIIKLQHRKMTVEEFLGNCDRDKLFSNKETPEKIDFFNKIVPWTFFPSRLIYPFINGENIPEFEIKQIGFFCGKTWKCRNPFKKRLLSMNIEFIGSDQSLKCSRPLTDRQYFEKMATSKYGIILHGRSSRYTDCKNRREIDYMFLKKPILMNYKPYYYNSLIEGKHYIYIDENTDLTNLEKMYNIVEIAQNGYNWYLENASKTGLINTFKQIVNERLLI